MMLSRRCSRAGESLFEGANVSLHARGEISIERDGGCRVRIRETRAGSGARARSGRRRDCERGRDGLLMRRIGEGEQQRDGDGFGICGLNPAAKFVERCFARREENGAVGCRCARRRRSSSVGDGRGAMVVPVVEIGTGLAGDGECVFESGGGDESDARAFAFEQRIGGDGGAVADFDRLRRCGCAILLDRVEDGAAGSSGVEGSLSTSMRLPRRGRRSR